MTVNLSTIVCFVLVFGCICEAKKSDKIRLEKVQVLTLNADAWTTGRRSSPIKQLTCVGGYCGKARVSSAQCYNRGFDGRDVQWECKAEMPASYKFGRIEVICEGYDYPEDDYVLVGSCGLEYTIDGTGTGATSDSSYSKHYYSAQSHIKDSNSGGFWPIVIIIGLIALIYFTCLRAPNNAYSSTSSSDDFPRPSAPPPPPGFRSEYYDSSDSCGRGAQPGTSSSGPGFYSGMAAGGLMGYLFGSGRSNTSSYYNRPYSSAYSGYDYGPSTSGTSSSSSGGGSETRTSSGFGSTRRR